VSVDLSTNLLQWDYSMPSQKTFLKASTLYHPGLFLPGANDLSAQRVQGHL
jgi:hypothetical protein